MPVVRRPVILGGLGLVVAIAIGVAVWVGASRRAPEGLDPAIIASLASQGITLAAPPTTSVPITREQAKANADQGFPKGTNDSRAILANVAVQPNAALNCTCWVVSRLLGTGHYNVTFIDAQSGRYEFELESYIQA